jgi:hypothetical protein
MAARINPAATQFSRARASEGRCQQAHHQTCLIEVECMTIPIAAIGGRRNWICGGGWFGNCPAAKARRPPRFVIRKYFQSALAA